MKKMRLSQKWIAKTLFEIDFSKYSQSSESCFMNFSFTKIWFEKEF